MAAATLVVGSGASGAGDGTEPGIGRAIGDPYDGSSFRGFWSGTTDSGGALMAFVLRGGRTWGVWRGGAASQWEGVLQGQLNGIIHDMSLREDHLVLRTWTSCATVQPRSTLDVVLTRGTRTTRFHGVYDAAFESEPHLAAAAGVYAGSDWSTGISVRLRRNGTFIGNAGRDSWFKGTMLPRTDANLFDVTLVRKAASCVTDQVYAGVGTYSPSARRLTMLVATESHDDRLLFVGMKP